MVAHDGWLLFAADDGTNGVELWRSDGTGPGTVMVADLHPGPSSSHPRDLVSVGGGVVFHACDANGCEPWLTDGTAVGTVPFAEIAAGTFSSNPTGFTRVGSRLLFAAERPADGRELWAIDLGTCGNALPELGEQCDDGGLADADGCSGLCRDEDLVYLQGTAEGGSVSLTVEGVTLVVTTAPGESASAVAANLAAAIAGSQALTQHGISAIAVEGMLAVAGSVDDVALADAGLAFPVPALAPLGGISVVLLLASLGAQRLRRRA